MEYELVHEIKNQCPNNQMRDVFFKEIETEDPVEYVRKSVTAEVMDLVADRHDDGSVTVHASIDGLIQTFTFTPI